jgi:hypothetical protein
MQARGQPILQTGPGTCQTEATRNSFEQSMMAVVLLHNATNKQTNKQANKQTNKQKRSAKVKRVGQPSGTVTHMGAWAILATRT